MLSVLPPILSPEVSSTNPIVSSANPIASSADPFSSPPTTGFGAPSSTFFEGQSLSSSSSYVQVDTRSSAVATTPNGNWSPSSFTPGSKISTQTSTSKSTSLSASISISAPTSTLASTSALAPAAPTSKPVTISKIPKSAIFGGGAGLVILIFIVGVLWYCRRRKRNAKPILHPFRDEMARDSEPLGTEKSIQPDMSTSSHTLLPPNPVDIGSNQNLPSATSSNAVNLRISHEDHDIEEPRPSPMSAVELQMQNELQMIRLEVGELQAMMRTPVPPYSPTHGV